MTDSDAEPLSETELLQEWLNSARYGDLEYLQQIYAECQERGQCPVSWQSDSKNTALHMASANGHVDIVQFLLEDLKVPCDIQNSEGNTALHWAALNGHLPVVNLLLKHGAPIDMRNNGGRSALFEAQRHDREEVVQVLLATFPEEAVEE